MNRCDAVPALGWRRHNHPARRPLRDASLSCGIQLELSQVLPNPHTDECISTRPHDLRIFRSPFPQLDDHILSFWFEVWVETSGCRDVTSAASYRFPYQGPAFSRFGNVGALWGSCRSPQLLQGCLHDLGNLEGSIPLPPTDHTNCSSSFKHAARRRAAKMLTNGCLFGNDGSLKRSHGEEAAVEWLTRLLRLPPLA